MTNIEIDINKVREFARRGLNQEQVAQALGISGKTLLRHKKKNQEIEAAYRQGRAEGVATIANALFEKASQGNVTAQIFYLKCHGWKEASELEVKSSISGANGGPIEIKNTAALSNEQLLDIIHSYKDESK